MPYGTPGNSAPDLNTIPGPLVERVEVLTGGASAVYGSDAIAGVVNFIMRDNFEGLRLDAQYGYYQHSNDSDQGNIRNVIAGRAATNPAQFALPPDDVNDGFSKEVTVMFGASSPDGRGNVTAYAGYRNNDFVLQRDRDFSACALAAPVGVNFTCGGSGTASPAQIGDLGNFPGVNVRGLTNPLLPFNATTNPFLPGTSICEQQGGTLLNNCGGQYTPTGGTNTFRRFVNATDQFNFAPTNYYQRPDERYTMGAFAHYEINPRAEVYAQMMHSDYHSVAQIAPSGNFGNTGSVNCDNPLLSVQQEQLLCEGWMLTAANVLVGPFDGSLVAPDPDGPRLPGKDGILFDNPLTLNIDEGADDTGTAVASNTDPDGPGPLTAADNPNPDRRVIDPDPVTPGNQGIAPIYVLRRNTEGGGRQSDIRYENYRTVLGVRGELTEGWDYDVFASYSHNQFTLSQRNDFSVTRLGRALDVVNTGPDGILVDDPLTLGLNEAADNAPICRSVINGTDPACVPWNVFTTVPVGAAALAYLQIPELSQAEIAQQVVGGTVTGDFGFAFPGAESPVQASFGLEYRRDEVNQIVDATIQSGDGAGFGPGNPLSGAVDVFEVFGEARVPIIEGAPFADLLALDLAYRYSDYSSGVQTDTYKIGAEWAPIESLRFRASLQQAVRAANVIEQFSLQIQGLFNMAFDPCDAPANGVNTNAAIGANCIGTAPHQVTAGQSAGGALNSPAGQYNGLFGGNPNVAPEESETRTFGLVFQPDFIPGLNISVDYFDIDIQGLISIVGAASTINDCYTTANPTSCSKIFRNPGTGQLWLGTTAQVLDLNTNIGGLTSKGYDINANYNFDIGDAGSVGLQLIGTFVTEGITDPGAATGQAAYDCVGLHGQGCGVPTPEWRHRFRASWETPWNLEVDATWRYFGEAALANANGVLIPGRIDSVLDAENYLDLAGNFTLYENTRFRFGVNNVLDNDPPIMDTNVQPGTLGNGNTYPQVYDSLGRWVFMGVTVDF
jgi:iron complex outermembrane recepter protein